MNEQGSHKTKDHNNDGVGRRSTAERKKVNQRNFRERRANYIRTLEERVRELESKGLEQTIQMQALGRQLQQENMRLRKIIQTLLRDDPVKIAEVLGPTLPATALMMSLADAAPGGAATSNSEFTKRIPASPTMVASSPAISTVVTTVVNPKIPSSFLSKDPSLPHQPISSCTSDVTSPVRPAPISITDETINDDEESRLSLAKILQQLSSSPGIRECGTNDTSLECLTCGSSSQPCSATREEKDAFAAFLYQAEHDNSTKRIENEDDDGMPLVAAWELLSTHPKMNAVNTDSLYRLLRQGIVRTVDGTRISRAVIAKTRIRQGFW